MLRAHVGTAIDQVAQKETRCRPSNRFIRSFGRTETFPKIYNLETAPLIWFPTQMFAPSKVRPTGPTSTLKVPSTAPSLARSLVTFALLEFVTHTLAPSKATP